MEVMLYFALFMLLSFGLVLVARPLTVLLHELGHAVPALFLTRQKVTVYAGSYGDSNGTVHFRIGLLEVYFKYNPFSWNTGLCSPSATSSIYSQILYTISGPIASFIIASVSCYFAFTFELHGFLKLFLIIFLGSAVFDLIFNLIPNEAPVVLQNGHITYRDGFYVKLLFNYIRFSKKYEEALGHYNQKQYQQAASLFDFMLNRGLRDRNTYRAAITSYLQTHDYKMAHQVYERLMKYHILTDDDWFNLAICYTGLGLPEKGIEAYDRALTINPNHSSSLNNKGYALILLDKFDEAIPLFDKAIELDNGFAYAYNNRGFCKINAGNLEDGLSDVTHSLQLDPENSYGYRNLGIYYLYKEEYGEALRLFNKAKDLYPETACIDQYIEDARKNLTANASLH
ncbi:tetratricopeptide repeat protein [Ohtaekwangia kribbensis]|uniref:Tetratricopeptide repeat protein n=1 Tax=Ohtaekwangia kribbensis TaxID=688913 RepID=A0ABW3K3I4_9BACT